MQGFSEKFQTKMQQNLVTSVYAIVTMIIIRVPVMRTSIPKYLNQHL